MKINFTQTYRLWFLLTSTSVLGLLITYFMGYDPLTNVWIVSYHNMHTMFTGMLLAAVLTRLYMAIYKINPVPLMHLMHAKSFLDILIALAYISMCSVLLITLGTEFYFLLTPKEEHALSVYTLRNFSQPIFAIMVFVHVLYVLYVNLIKKRDSLRNLLLASDADNKTS